MKLLSWNSRGLGNPRRIRSLRKLVKREAPDLVFLQETKVLSSFFSFRKFGLGYKNALAVDRDGKSGGLVLLWKEDINFEVVCYSPNIIHDFIIVGDGCGQRCLLIGVYGIPEASWRHIFWDNLKGLSPSDETPWIVFRDFKKILFHSEK